MNTSINEAGFWKKLQRVGSSASRELAEKALWLYYAARRPETPTWARSVIIGALGYFILPLDAVPDFIPAAGYTDDLTVLAAAIAAVAFFINDEVKLKATQTLARWAPKRSQSKSNPSQIMTTTETPLLSSKDSRSDP